ncbi:hypothetical protein MPS_0819 [Mycobacterium pseudoshottsii JCM 15466]|uniref:Uncharacterized protein n=1 Tax=Mycobacterium ulcerans str. Harvey TaxID=1299332 RepID=A0ABP3A1E1_MYCUL|nr:hypothetical protein I551_8141 [Mycobacterium ulcerans str. Harvey]GAQ32439.1 hypothetical protein MPS_0819 [Mycobacterium pseudoshottsii JCM 15466]
MCPLVGSRDSYGDHGDAGVWVCRRDQQALDRALEAVI